MIWHGTRAANHRSGPPAPRGSPREQPKTSFFVQARLPNVPLLRGPLAETLPSRSSCADAHEQPRSPAGDAAAPTRPCGLREAASTEVRAAAQRKAQRERKAIRRTLLVTP